jgi:hypothetical protein
VIDAGNAVVFEDRVGLRIFLGERVALDAVMLEEGLYFHSKCEMKVGANVNNVE